MKFLHKLLFFAATALAVAIEEMTVPDNGCVESIPEGRNPANVSLYTIS